MLPIASQCLLPIASLESHASHAVLPKASQYLESHASHSVLPKASQYLESHALHAVLPMAMESVSVLPIASQYQSTSREPCMHAVMVKAYDGRREPSCPTF